MVALTTCCLTEISSAHASCKPQDHHRQGTQANTDAADNRNARNVCSERLLRGAPSRTRTCAPGSGGRCSNPLSYGRLSLPPHYSREPGSLQPKLRWRVHTEVAVNGVLTAATPPFHAPNRFSSTVTGIPTAPFPPASVFNNRDQLGRGRAALTRRGSMPRLVVGGTQVGYIA
jgi:hypothetical protein